MNNECILQASSEHAGLRVDVFLAQQLVDISRSRIKSLLLEGCVFCTVGNTKSTLNNPSYKLKGTENFIIILPAPKVTEVIPQNIPLTVLYEDAEIIVIDKAIGMAVHPGAGIHEGTLVNALLHHYPDIHIGNVQRPGIVHRLDKDTSGVMVCARNDKAHQALSAAFKAREVKKVYKGFCLGKFERNSFELKTGHRRHATDRKRFTTRLEFSVQAGPTVRFAHSSFTVTAFNGGVSAVDVLLHTGRTHQIRAHVADVGKPLIADVLYGGGTAVNRLPQGPVRDCVQHINRHALHAWKLGFEHPTTKEWMEFIAPLPNDLQKLNDALISPFEKGGLRGI